MKALPKKTPVRRRIGPALLVSGLIHLQVIALLGVTAYFAARRNAALLAAAPLEVTTLDDEASRAIVAEMEKQEEKKAEEEKKKEEESPNTDKQVVENPGPQTEAPKESKYAAEHDSSVERETHRHGVPKPQREQQAQQPGLLAMRAPSPRTAPPGTRGVPGATPPLSGQDPQTETTPPPGQEARAGGPPAPPEQPPKALALMPTRETLSRALGAGTSDYLPDVDEGEDTALNAKKWKFASFFNRVKEQIRQHWRAAQEYQKRDPTGTLYGGKVRYTVLRVALMPDGSLADVHLEKASGVDFLDDVAVEAVREAQPFPNPPQQLVDPAAGKISFKFGFVVDLSGETRLRMFRYSSM
jgi:TonB family protein